MATFKLKTSGIMNTEYNFVGSEKDLWAWMKEKFDEVEDFSTTKYDNYGMPCKCWLGSMKNGRISKKIILDTTKGDL